MPFKSKAQQRFMFSQHPEMAKEWADKTPDISKLPEHVKKMAMGGDVDHDEPGLQDATVSDAATLAGLAGLAGMAPELMEAAPEMLGSEAGEVSLGAAPEMEGMPSKIQVFSKGIQKDASGNPITTIWGVKGAPEDLMKEFGSADPGSVPEHILKAKGLLPTDSVKVPDQMAPNDFAKGGEVMDKNKVNDMSDIGTLAGLRDLLRKASGQTDTQKADDIDPVISSSTDTPKGYAFGGETNPKHETVQSMENNPTAGFADGGDVNPFLQGAATQMAQPVDTENGGTPSAIPAMDPGVDQDFINKLNTGMNLQPAPTPPIPSPIIQASTAAQGIPPTNPSIYQGISADDRAAMLQKLLAAKGSGANLVASGVAGLGDAISNAFGKGGQNTQGALREAQNQNINTRMGAVDTQRQQRMQDLQANLAQQENDPSSAYSQGMRSFYSQLTGRTFPSGISASMMKQAFPDYAKIFDSQLTAATAQRGQTLGTQEKLATKGPFQRLVDNIFGNKAEETLSNETGISTPAQNNGGWSVVK